MKLKKKFVSLTKIKLPKKTIFLLESLKENIDVTAEFLCTNINSAIKSGRFLSLNLPYSILPYSNVGSVGNRPLKGIWLSRPWITAKLNDGF